VQALDERDDEHAAAHDDLLAAEIGGDEPRLRVTHLLALAAGDDERLVGFGHFVAARDQQADEDQQHDEAEDRDQYGTYGGHGVPFLGFSIG
jgi:hypothetical protein